MANKAPGAGITFGSRRQWVSKRSRSFRSALVPDAPLQEFLHRTKDMPQTTEAERLVVQRVGQNIFRDRLINYWQSKCPLTGITDRALLRASHIIPWKDCSSDAERLDVHNGFLLSALWDAAFDRGLITFDDSGWPSPAQYLFRVLYLHGTTGAPLDDSAIQERVLQAVKFIVAEAAILQKEQQGGNG